MEFKFSKFSSIRSKALCLSISKPTKRLAAQSTARALRNRQRKQASVKENEKNIYVKEICKFLDIYGWTIFPTNDFLLLENCRLYIIAKYKARNCSETEAVIQRCSVKCSVLWYNQTQVSEITKFHFQLFLTALNFMGSFYIVTK